MSEHWLKTAPEFYGDVESGRKPFEVRIDDRTPPYEAGDTVHLQEYVDGKYSGRETVKTVTYVLRDSRYCKHGFCILGLTETEKYWIGYGTVAYNGRDDCGEPKWIPKRFYRCPVCRTATAVQTAYCAHCGVKLTKYQPPKQVTEHGD